MKVWMWQRLYGDKFQQGEVTSELQASEDHIMFGEFRPEEDFYWLCPKPNLVLVDRKHLGGVE